METPEPFAVAVHGEVRHRPDHLPQEEHHRADVEELEAKALVAALHDLQACGTGAFGLDLVISTVARPEWAEKVLADLDVGPAANVLGEVRATRRQHSRDLIP